MKHEEEFHDKFYDAEAERIFTSPLYRRLLDLHVEILAAVTPDLSSARVLSIGCGDGRRELAMARHARRIVGFDISRVAIERARVLAQRSGISNVEFEIDDASGLEQRFPAHFDAVWCLGVLHHLNDRQVAELLRSAEATLKAGGCFVSMDPNSHRAVNVFKPFFRRTFDKYHSPDERELRPHDVVEKLRAAGFGEIEVRFADWFISPLAWLAPRLSGPLAPLLVWVDQLLVRAPFLKRFSSGFAVVARTER